MLTNANKYYYNMLKSFNKFQQKLTNVDKRQRKLTNIKKCYEIVTKFYPMITKATK